MKRRLPRSVLAFVGEFHERGFECHLVGGAVRNLLLGNRPADFDFTTNVPPDVVIGMFRRVIPTGVDHGTVTVLYRGESFEVTTYRTESAYTDSRRPDQVAFVGDIREDLARRDFTMNGIAYDPVAGVIVDPFGGREDIDARLIRAIGDPEVRLEEDALRMMRAVRFAAQLEFRIDAPTLHAIAAMPDRVTLVSPERVRDELVKLIESPRPSIGLRLMAETGLLPHVLPELAEGVGVEQRGNHRFDVFEHSLRACDAAPPDNLLVRLAALFHDVGKPRAMEEAPDGTRRFHGHDRISATMTEEALRRLRFPNRTIESVTQLVREHMFNYTDEWTDAAVRRFLVRVGPERVDDLLALRLADSEAIRGEPVDVRPLGRFAERIREQIDLSRALSIRDLAVNGHDLMEAGIPRGPELGVVLNALLEAVLDDPSLNTRERLLEIAGKFYEERIERPKQ